MDNLPKWAINFALRVMQLLAEGRPLRITIMVIDGKRVALFNDNGPEKLG